MPNPGEPGTDGQPPVEPRKPNIADPLDAILELREENKKLRLEMKQLKDEQSTRDRTSLEEQGKYKELHEKLLKEHEPLVAKVSSLEAEVATHRELEKKRREALLEKLPEEKRPIYADVPMSALEDVVATHTTKPNPTAAPKGGQSQDERVWEKYTFDELAELQVKDFAKWSALRDDYAKRKGVRLV